MNPDTITVAVNGDKRQLSGQPSLLELLQLLDLDPRRVVVELNRQIVRQSELPAFALRDGDRVELVHFVGGG